MAVGLAGAVVLAAALGLAVQPIARMLGLAVPGNVVATIVDLAVAVAGLAAGWFLLPLPARAERWVSDGFRVHGGFVGTVVQPVMAVAALTDRMDTTIHRGVLAVGKGGLALASASRTMDERGIDGIIRALVRDVRVTGMRTRGLQSGLVSRELALSVGAIGVLIVLLLILR